MQYSLRNGEKVIVCKPRVEDAQTIINVMTLADNDIEWFVAEYENKEIEQCSVGLVRKMQDIVIEQRFSYWGPGMPG